MNTPVETFKSAQSIKLDLIKTDAGTQPRAILSDDVVAEYSERMIAGDKFPPVDVFHDGSEYILADGFHRFFGAKRAEFRDILAIVHQGTRLDAIWFAVGANRTNGFHRSKGDVRNAVVIALKEFDGYSQDKIAAHVGCSQGYVAKVKADIIPRNIIPPTRQDSTGRNRPTQYKKPEPEKEPEPEQEPTPPTNDSQWKAVLPNVTARDFEPSKPKDLEEARMEIIMGHFGAIEEGVALITKPENLKKIRSASNHIDALARHGAQTPAAA